MYAILCEIYLKKINDIKGRNVKIFNGKTLLGGASYV